MWQKIIAKRTQILFFLSQYFIKKLSYRIKQGLPHLKNAFSNHLPVVHLRKKMDWSDYVLNFSGETIAFSIVLIVAAANVLAFGVFSNGDRQITDKSLAGEFLSRHPKINPALYAKTNSIKTTVLKQPGFITTAFAEESVLSFHSEPEAIPQETGASIGEDSITKPNPDTTRELMAKQIEIYETTSNDTLGSIAKKYNIDIDTIKWANGLPNNTIKPGWFLKIPPTKGVLYQADSNDTLPDIANYFKGDLDRIIAYNNLENAEDIEPGRWIMCPDCSVPAPKVETPKPNQSKTTPAQKLGQTAKIVRKGGHIFPKGYCTYYVSTKVKVPHGGNANQWLGNARAIGIPTGSKPVPGAVVATSDNARYGHVAYVESVDSKYIYISEMNFVGFGVKSTRKIPLGDRSIKGYIYYP